MILTASTPTGEPVAFASAYLMPGGTRLRCPLLLIYAGTCQPGQPLTLKKDDTNEEITVKLPEWPASVRGHLRFDREELEVV